MFRSYGHHEDDLVHATGCKQPTLRFLVLVEPPVLLSLDRSGNFPWWHFASRAELRTLISKNGIIGSIRANSCRLRNSRFQLNAKVGNWRERFWSVEKSAGFNDLSKLSTDISPVIHEQTSLYSNLFHSDHYVYSTTPT
jgi:hypothetical protein